MNGLVKKLLVGEIVVEIVYIDRNKFLRDMVEYSIRQDGGTVFTLDALAGQSAIINDLTPVLAVIDLKFDDVALSNELPLLSIPLIAIGESSDQEKFNQFSKYFVSFEAKPLSPLHLRQRWLSLKDKQHG